MKYFKTSALPSLRKSAFGDMAVGQVFITRDFNPREGAIWMKMRKTGLDSSTLIGYTLNAHNHRLGKSYVGINAADVYFLSTEDAFTTRAVITADGCVAC